jgi:hypothetical protein
VAGTVPEQAEKRCYNRRMPFLALDVQHAGQPTQRFELITPRSLSFQVDGRVSRNLRSGRGSNPELLFIQWWRPRDAPSFHVTGARRGADRSAAQAAQVNGVDREQGQLSTGDTLRWHGFLVSVSEVPLLRAPELEMVEAARRSDAALEVYADWLETRGASRSAEWARLVLAPDEAQRAAGMQVLARELGASFRALVSRGRVERCDRSCGAQWEGLALKEEPWLRGCGTCERAVTWCEDAESARSVVGPVVLDPSAPRSPGDLLPRPMVVG